MMKKGFPWLYLSSLMLAVVIGCGGGGSVDLGQPQFAETKIAIAPFALDEGAEDMARLTLDLGTKLSLADEGKEWIYDQSDQIAPIAEVLEADQLTSEEVFIDPALAAKVGANVGADYILVGKIQKPRIQVKEDSSIYYDLNTYSVSGTQSRYVLIIQSATEDVKLKLINSKTGEIAWDGGIKGYTKYFREFRQTDPAKDYARVPEEQMKADMRSHMLKRIQYTLYPTQTAKVQMPEILLKPTRELSTSGGKPMLF